MVSIEAGLCFSDKVFLDQNYILLAPYEPISEDLLARLATWGYSSVFSKGRMQEVPKKVKKAEQAPVVDVETNESVEYYFEFIDSTQSMINNLRNGGELDRSTTAALVEKCIAIVRENKDEILRYPEFPFPSHDYLTVHLVNCAILAAATGGMLSKEDRHLSLLVEAAYLHDLGMTALPSALYEKQGPLTPEERQRVRGHTEIGHSLLADAGYPEAICRAASEHHEWLDGSGYPSGRSMKQISDLAKVVSVLCSFDAATSCRSYKEAVDPHTAILDMIGSGPSRYHPVVVKAFMHATAQYPPGTFVTLSDGSAGLVVRANENYPSMPTVRLLYDEAGIAVDDHKLVQTHWEHGIKVRQELKPEELTEYLSGAANAV